MPNRIIDRVMHRLGWVRWSNTIQGEIEFTRDEQPFVNLTLPGGNRVHGWVDNRIGLVTQRNSWGDNPYINGPGGDMPTPVAAGEPDPCRPTHPLYAEIVDNYEAQQKRP